MSHVVLLGDSIFDNKAYVGREPGVVEHLRAALPSGSQATLCAIDGSTTTDIVDQIHRVPADCTHLVMSIGGNDALLNADLLDLPVRSTAAALDLMAGRAERFEADYRAAVHQVAALAKPLILCTIYNGNFADAKQQGRARTALTIFNDVIIRVAREQHAALIDLRAVCCSVEDYANPIEPSGIGGKRIASAIAGALRLQQSAQLAATIIV